MNYIVAFIVRPFELKATFTLCYVITLICYSAYMQSMLFEETWLIKGDLYYDYDVYSMFTTSSVGFVNFLSLYIT